MGETVRGQFERLALKNLRIKLLTRIVKLEKNLIKLNDKAYSVLWEKSSDGFSAKPFGTGSWPPLVRKKKNTGFFFVTGDLQSFMTGKGVSTSSLGKPIVRLKIGETVSLKPTEVAGYFSGKGKATSILDALGNDKVHVSIDPYPNLSKSVEKGRASRGVIERQLFSNEKVLEKLTNPKGAYRNLVPNFLSWYLRKVIKVEVRKATRG